MRNIQRKWWVRSLEMFIASKIFGVKRKGVRDDVLMSNILFDDILMTWVRPTGLQVHWFK